MFGSTKNEQATNIHCVCCLNCVDIVLRTRPWHIGLNLYAKNLSLWQSSHITHYRFTVQSVCMCTIGTLKTYIVEVQNNRVKNVVGIDGKTPKWIKQSDTR